MVSKKGKSKLAKAKPPRPSSPQLLSFDPSPPKPSIAQDFFEAQAPTPEPEPDLQPHSDHEFDFDLDPADFDGLLTEPDPLLEPEPPTPPRHSPATKPLPIKRDHLNPLSARNKRPHSLPNPSISPPPNVDPYTTTPFGNSPHVVACISCDHCALLTNKHVFNSSKLGLRPNNTDSFIPVVCSSCEDDRALYWCRMASANSPPSHRTQYPGTISSKMLRSWFVFQHMQARFGVAFDEHEVPYKRVTRARDWWREGVLTESETVRLYFWAPAKGNDDEMEIVEKRRDLFFGQFVHPTQSV